ncbi:hypothetical protein, partial [Virgibacillus pantothenticus]
MRKSAILVVFMLIVQLFSTLTVLADSNKKGGDYNQLSEEEVFPNEADEAINKDESPKPKIENKSNLDTEGHSNYGTENNLEVEDKEAENESVPNSSIKDKATEKNTEQGVQENQDNGNEIKKEEVLESRTLTSQTINESNTSLLGHIKKGTKIYKTIGDTATSFSSDKYLNKVYYIKKQA